MHSGFLALRSALPLNCRRRAAATSIPHEARGDIDRIARIWRECRARYAAEGPYLFGGFSIADAMYAPVVTRFLTYGVELDAVCRGYVAVSDAVPAMQAWRRDAAAEPTSRP